MPNIKSAKKRVQVSERNRARNNYAKSTIRTAVKRVLEALQEKADDSSVKEKVNLVFSLMDRAVLKGILHKNTVARQKSRLMARVNKHNVA